MQSSIQELELSRAFSRKPTWPPPGAMFLHSNASGQHRAEHGACGDLLQNDVRIGLERGDRNALGKADRIIR